MSRNELIDAYRRGRISRRTFIQGMTAVGVSAVAATSMADRLRTASAAPNAQVDDDDDDVYTPTATVAATAAATATKAAGGTTQLPSTGSGAGDAGTSFWKPVAVAGAAAAAFVAAKYRKVRGVEAE